ncbi:MAE_28990/MAE_18760 family HEPN-like nuclease [Nostoc linckia]|nr:MAE_28990/MAE_18760 family HEPN-like nuclease [Nostoc linckia]
MTVTVNISTVRSIIKTNDRLREISFGSGAVIKQECHEGSELVLGTLMQDIPKVKEWRVYDHCAVVTRLYAIYERFVEDLVSDWLVLLPALFPLYSDLEDKIRNTHQIGVGRLLLELKKNRYEHLSLEEVIRGLFHGVTGEKDYDILPDAFLFHEQNLRREPLEKMLTEAGIPNSWGWVEKHRAVKYFLQEIRGNQNTVEGELNELISYRNDAAHGFPDDVLGSNALLELCDFVETLCQALAELVTYKVIERKKLIGQAKEIGRITEWYKKHKAGVAKVEETILSIGSSLFLVNEGSSCCYLATIESIKIDDISVDEVETITGMEVGLKFDVDAKEKLSLYRLNI